MNKKAFYRYFTIFMAFVVLLTSTGIGLVESHCMLRGKSLQLFSKEKKEGCKGCRVATVAPDSAGKTLLRKTNCCTEKHSFKNVSFLSSFSQLLAKLLKTVGDACTGLFDDLRLWTTGRLLVQGEAVSSACSFSSLLYGRSMLVFVQKFLI